MGSSRQWPCRPRGCCPCGRGGTWIAAGSRACSPAATGGCGGKSGGDDDCRQCRDCSGRCCCRDCCSPGYPRSSSGKMIQGLAPAPTTFASWRKRSPWRHHPSHGPNGRDGTPPNPPTAALPAPPQTAGPRRVGRRERGDTGLRAARREKQTSRESVHKGRRAGMREKGRGWRGKGRVGGSSPANACGTALVPNHGRWLPPAAHSVAIDPPPTSQPPIAGQPLPPARSADRAATSSPPAPPPPPPPHLTATAAPSWRPAAPRHTRAHRHARGELACPPRKEGTASKRRAAATGGGEGMRPRKREGGGRCKRGPRGPVGGRSGGGNGDGGRGTLRPCRTRAGRTRRRCGLPTVRSQGEGGTSAGANSGGRRRSGGKEAGPHRGHTSPPRPPLPLHHISDRRATGRLGEWDPSGQGKGGRRRRPRKSPLASRSPTTATQRPGLGGGPGRGAASPPPACPHHRRVGR